MISNSHSNLPCWHTPAGFFHSESFCNKVQLYVQLCEKGKVPFYLKGKYRVAQAALKAIKILFPTVRPNGHGYRDKFIHLTGGLLESADAHHGFLHIGSL